MNISREDIAKILNVLELEENDINFIIEDFDNILQPVIQMNYLSHLISAIENIINDKIKNELKTRIVEYSNEKEIKELLSLIDAKHFKVFPILLKPFPYKTKKKALSFDIKKGGAIILYDDNLEDKQKRLLIAHELGHLYMKYVSSHKSELKLEKIVTAFSIIAIMDKDDFYRNRSRNLISKSIVELLFKFN